METDTGDLWQKAEKLRADDFHAGNPKILHRALQNHIEILQGQSDPAGASYAATVVDLLDISRIKFDTSIDPDTSIQEIREAYTGFESLQRLALGILKSSPSSVDFEKAIRYCNLSLDMPDRSSEDMATSHRILGHTYLTRFRAENNMKDLDEARKAYDEALTLCPETSSSYHLFLAASAHVHLVNFNFTGATQDQHSAIHRFRRALGCIPSDHPSRPRLLMHTGCAIATRFGQLGQQGDLQDAMKLLDEARNTYDDHHPDKPYCLSAYATALQARYLFSRKLDDLDNALAIHRSIIDRVPELSDKHVGFLSGLSLTLHAVADTSEGILRRNYLQEGVDNAQKAVELADTKNPRRPFLLGEAAHRLYKLFKVTGVEEHTGILVYSPI
ncbi:uncharacterized protein STEHIDRAFT_153301 [Stereum hirsutum FP-91666 SS1]|uniref:uncharacterized protein n=1 Tax=Stereum hirsutum (strain FP-91666) TaxID=721885 RepID=UPI000440EAF8|nr:uncharacterized protein STEHIDRAFT_153301 [Stereum hirsutum FP-91666 SS1]EIM91680.1 hypothetical protein STEHIDRAFT_153301 [Stereum hirsutum FP-91666 SS1]